MVNGDLPDFCCSFKFSIKKSFVLSGKSATAAAGEFEFTFTNTEVHKIVRISKTDQDNPNLQNAFKSKHHQLHFCVTNFADYS